MASTGTLAKLAPDSTLQFRVRLVAQSQRLRVRGDAGRYLLWLAVGESFGARVRIIFADGVSANWGVSS